MSEPLQFSRELESILNAQVNLPVIQDVRTDLETTSRLGYPYPVISKEVLRKGRIDFSVGHTHPVYGELSADDKVLLYCFMNMKQHLFESIDAFRTHLAELRPIFQTELPTRMIDLGCGPATAALALTECLSRPNLHYVGMDIAKPMLKKAESMLQTAIDALRFGANTGMMFLNSWAALQRSATNIPVPINVFFNATYLFASESLQVEDLMEIVLAYKRSTRVHRMIFCYTNTAHELAGPKYEQFKKRLKMEILKVTGESKKTINYRKRRGAEAIGSATYVNEIIRLKWS